MIVSYTLSIFQSSTLPIISDSSNLTLFQPYNLAIIQYLNLNHTLFHTTLFQSYTLPILHSSNLTLFKSYTLTLLHSDTITLWHSDALNLTLFQSYTLTLLHSDTLTLWHSDTLTHLHVNNNVDTRDPFGSKNLEKFPHFFLRVPLPCCTGISLLQLVSSAPWARNWIQCLTSVTRPYTPWLGQSLP